MMPPENALQLETLLFVPRTAKGNGPTDASSAFFAMITPCWLAGAVALLFRHRWAWYVRAANGELNRQAALYL